MARAEIWSGRGMEETTTTAATKENGAVSLRRRRMEIRRIKMMTNASSSNVFVEQPVSKRLRPVSGVSSMRDEGGGGGGGGGGGEGGGGGGGGDGGFQNGGGGGGAGAVGRVVMSGEGVVMCSEWGAERSDVIREPVGLQVDHVEDDDEVDDDDDDVARSSFSQARESPSGGVLAPCEGNDRVNRASQIVGNHRSDRMSSGGSSSSGQHNEESDGSSSLTSVGGFNSTLGNESVAAHEFSQTHAAGPRSSGAQQSSQTLSAGLHSSGAQETPQSPAAGLHSSGTAEMAGSIATESLDAGHVDNQNVDMPGAYPQHNTSPWQASGNEGIVDSSAVVAGDAGGSSAPSNCFASNACPPHGMVSLCGRRREMEDAVVAKESFVMLPCNKAGGCDASGLEDAPLHYFGVYDGHGGSQAANFCAERLHHALAEEVVSCFVQGQNVDQIDWESKWLTTMTQCFKKMDAEVGGICLEEGECQAGDNHRCCPEPIAPEAVGTTAIVAVVGACQIIVGNCGDSRAVLSRGGIAIPLSVDHKPEREDEMARVEAAGGRVIYWNGYRVLGILAMSRAIGDRYLKPYVIADPEVKCVKRAADDECLILASDGLWDVMSNEVVCDIARRALNCRRNGQPLDPSLATGSSDEESPAAQAAALLVKLALAKGSSDNISVVVVDLKVNR
ncbi:hypothetical protein KC19_3G194600 [Ceratodon purpureus]|uniref:protein-serine/threonine phosphatase n=2 Tax=Ceratodon purpureus TaxID=3225 RepID=A0A8T0ILU0_CERPU|nr:hypothetical protein KC19_3G194600 [Ceratodon purpureus]